MSQLKSRQRGEFLMARALLLVLILLAMLIIPVWIKRGNDDKMNAGLRAEQEKNSGSATASATPPVQEAPGPTKPTENTPAASAVALANSTTVAPRPIGHGLTFALAPVVGKAAADTGLAHLSCHGEPRQVDQPHQDSCNPYKGDTSCRVVLPVLCFQGTGLPQPPDVQAGQYTGWSGGVLGATQPVMGAILTSESAGTARCEKELGAGWRMASFHDAGGWGMQGQRGLGLVPNTRFWVHIKDQLGNCWDSRP